ncbi:MAG TPA: DUF402 domain-containing protein [Micromonosporaceae bacterium]|jgi:hypothetical protein
MRFQAGQVCVRRLMHPDGRLGGCVAGRVVSDDEAGLLMWIDGDSQMVRPTTMDGKPTRVRPYAEELRLPLLPGLTTWFPGGGALVLTPPAAPYSVLWFFDNDAKFTGWYVNLEAPAHRWWGGLDIHDKALDVLVAPDRTWHWKDEDEFAAQTGHPFFWDEIEAAQIRRAGLAAVERVEAGDYPFDGTWCDFTPDPAWGPTELPWWWDAVRT